MYLCFVGVDVVVVVVGELGGGDVESCFVWWCGDFG